MHEVVVVGSGIGGLSAAAWLAKSGLKPLIIEQNWQPGGCTSSYWRKGFVFEAGATTLVGLDKGMPLRRLLDETGVQLPVRKLELPMQVHLPNGRVIQKHENINQWITEAKRHFGGNQEAFWREAHRVSQFVWNASTRFLHFPPARISDLVKLALKARPSDLIHARYAVQSTASVLDRFGLTDPIFRRYIDEQLLITAQNHAPEVNFLFGAAALCYTNYGNYYVDGGLINLAKPLVNYVEKQGGSIQYREEVRSIQSQNDRYQIITKNGNYEARQVVWAAPFNNLIDAAPQLAYKSKKKLLSSEKLYSAYQLGVGFHSERIFESLHHQIHLRNPLPQLGSNSFFVSLSHPEDSFRSDEKGLRVASISTHIRHPAQTEINSEELEQVILNELEQQNFLKRENIVYLHSSGPKSWQKWTGRAHGFVGGYPQYLSTKPWQMIEHRLDGRGAYLCGDSSYPGQGIPGATLSGIIAAEKLLSDHF